MRKLILICISILCCLSCKHDGYRPLVVLRFPLNKPIKGEFLFFEKMPLLPNYISIIDTLIVVKNKFCDSSFFYVYHLNTHKQLGSFGTRGKGSKEFLDPLPTGQYVKTDSSISIWINDVSQLKYKLINLTKTIRLKETVIEREITGLKSIDTGLNVFILPNNDMLGTCMSQKGRLFYFDSENKKTKWVEFFPGVSNPPIKQREMHSLYNSETGISPDGRKIVSALRLFKRIDVFDNELNHLFSLIFKNSPKEPDFFRDQKNPLPKTLKHYYGGLYLSKNCIYALNYNMTQKQIEEGKDTCFSEIQVFYYVSDPVAVFKLDHSIISFAVDEKKGYIYGLPFPKEGSKTPVIRYKIKLNYESNM